MIHNWVIWSLFWFMYNFLVCKETISSIETKFHALVMATAEIYWLHILFQELHVPLSMAPTIWCDNLGAIALISNTVYHLQTKHIEVDYHFIQEKCD
jgi:hypothetical protein